MPTHLNKSILICLLMLCLQQAHSQQLRYDPARGVLLQTAQMTVCVDRNEHLSTPVIRFLPDGGEVPLSMPSVHTLEPGHLQLHYHLRSPNQGELDVERDLILKADAGGTALTESFRLAGKDLPHLDVEIERPFTIQTTDGIKAPQAILPLQIGWARTLPITSEGIRGEYRLGNVLAGKETNILALPVAQVSIPSQRCVLCSDPTFSSLFSLHLQGDAVTGSIRYRYASHLVALPEQETRTFGFWLASGRTEAADCGDALDAFFRLMLPDVPPGPAWIHRIALVDYDHLSENGAGWERDLRTLARLLTPQERQRVAVCLHGWYDALGSYSYDAQNDRMREQWIAFPRTSRVPFTQAELKRRLHLAKDLGFRTLLYFADGLASDSGSPHYRPEWTYKGPDGKPIPAWQGEDTIGKTYLMNVTLPEVQQWFQHYLQALLRTYGGDIDGLVWDETFHAPIGRLALEPKPAYCDRAMFELIRTLRRQVKAYDPEKVFFASDCIGIQGSNDPPGYAMVTDGTFQDTAFVPFAWPYGMFPAYRNCLWSCNWYAHSRFHFERWGVETFGVPLAIGNGAWGDNRGINTWEPWEQQRLLRLFRERLQQNDRVRFLLEDPTQVWAQAPHVALVGDPIPAPAPDEVNWASYKNHSKAIATSEEHEQGGVWEASGVTTDLRDDSRWGKGSGWVSQRGAPLPQRLAVDFGQPRTIRRFIVITYQHENSDESAAKWGVRDYTLDVWDDATHSWRTVVTEAGHRTAKIRVYSLPQPIRTRGFRIVVNDVWPLDGQARLLQLEAWGPKEP